MEQYKLFEAEYKFMHLVWEHEPVNSTVLSKLCKEELGWKKPTTYNMLRKLVARELLQNEQAIVSSLVKMNQVLKYESVAIVEKAFAGSLPAFLTAFLDTKKISEKEAAELRQIIEEATR
ncbi:MAG: BlaI/MecI/CopY family transcriptional regulator [Clostridia bacterium]